MNEKREVILPSDFSGEKGKIVCYRISSYLELLYIDIRSRRIPEVQIQPCRRSLAKCRSDLFFIRMVRALSAIDLWSLCYAKNGPDGLFGE